jgi:hypothetical protein
MVNLAKNPVFKKDIEKHRKYLEQHAIQNNDSLALDMLSLIFTKQD